MNKTFRLTYHATERLNYRLNRYLTAEEVLSTLNSKNIPQGKHFVEIKKTSYIEIQDPSVVPDGIARGDQFIAVVENDNDPRVVTIVLRKSWSKSSNWQNVIK